MNIIQQAAEALYPGDRFCDPPDYVSVRHYEEHVTHFLQFLSQQGDEEIVNVLSTWHNGYNIQEKIQQALAIGRASNRWIPVSERLPEEKDAVEWSNVKAVETLYWIKDYRCWQSDVVSWNDQWLKNKNPHYWRTPSQYPEPPKSEL